MNRCSGIAKNYVKAIWPIASCVELKAIAKNSVSAIAKICDAIAKNYESIANNCENRQQSLNLDTRADCDKLSLKYNTLEINYDLLQPQARTSTAQ